MTERTARIGALPLTLMIAALMTSLTGCGGCSSEPEAASGESSEQATAMPGSDSGSGIATPTGDATSKAIGDAGRVAERASKASKKTVKDVPSEVEKSPPPPGPLDANAKRLANRKTLEADLKKRANRRRGETQGAAAKPAAGPAATAPRNPAAAPADSPLTRAVPNVRAGAAKGTGAAVPKPKLLKIGRYMTITDARKLTGDATLSKGKPLTGIEPSASYNVSYFAPQLRSKFGVSVQVWKEKIRRDANDRYRKMKRDFPNAEDTTAISPSAIFSHFQGIMSLSFVDLTKSVVVSVSCGDTVCSDDELVALASTVKKRL
jgi:hypothetical protein